MSGSINSVTLLGNLTRDPEIRTVPSGGKIANISLATSESWKDKTTGERKERTEYHRIVIQNERISEVAERYLRKGSKVAVQNAQIQTRKWQGQDGKDNYSTEIVIGRFKGELVLLDRKQTENAVATADSAEPPF